MDNIIFHIGMPKTGSSALQVFFAKNRVQLLQKSVDYFPLGDFNLSAAGHISSGNGSLIARALLDKGHPASLKNAVQIIEEFLKTVRDSSANTGIISSELFAEADKDLLVSLFQRLKSMGIRAQIYYLVRYQPQILSSIYIQQVKRHNCTESPQDFIMKNYKTIRFLRYHSYYEYLSPLVGKDDIVIDVYEKAIKSEGLFKSFLNHFGIQHDSIDFSVSDVNTSLSSKEIALMLILNTLRPRMQFSDFVVENSKTFGLSRSGGLHSLISGDCISEIDGYFKSENELLADAYFDGAPLFPPTHKTSEADAISGLSLDVSDIVKFLGGLLVRYDLRLASLEGKLAEINKTLIRIGEKSP